jgi:hypothetical protein
MKKLIVLVIGLSALVFTMVSCSTSSNGDKILIVQLVNKDSGDKPSEEEYIKLSLLNGGYITLDVDTIRKIDSKFDEKYATADSKGKFLVLPAILNFVGGQGWNLRSISGGLGNADYYFTKSR